MLVAIEGVSKEEREEWLNHPCSEALAIYFEIIRMVALEGLESGATGDDVPKLAGQASLCADIRRFITESIANVNRESLDDDSFD